MAPTDWTDADARTTPVDRDRCLWCKHPPDDDRIELDTGESLCGECAGDLREFKRSVFIDFLVAASLRPSVRAAVLDEWQDVQSVLARWHRDDQTLRPLPTRVSYEHERSRD